MPFLMQMTSNRTVSTSVERIKNQFNNVFDNSPDGLVSFQLTAGRLPRHLVYLGLRRTRFERRQLDKLLQIYSELAGLYEKLVRLVIGLVEICEGKEVDY
jgi:hypothetical protein